MNRRRRLSRLDEKRLQEGRRKEEKERMYVAGVSLLISVCILSFIFVHWFFDVPKQLVEEGVVEDVLVSSADQEDVETGHEGEKTLSVMTYNIHYGKGSLKDSDQSPSMDEMRANLERIGDIIGSSDIVALQEVDFYAKRSYYVDQAEFLARYGGFPYVAKAIDWDVKYVPYPVWPPSKHYGRLQSGIVVLSKYPLIRNVRYLLPKPEENSWFYNLFYIDRLVQYAAVKINGMNVNVFNVHIEAFKKNTREKQANRVLEIAEGKNPAIVLGDFNAVPPEATQRSHFEDEPEIDYEDRVIASVREKLHDVFTGDGLELEPLAESKRFTHPAESPNRELDYIFVSDDFTVLDRSVVASAGSVSDHLPIHAVLKKK